MLMTSASGPNSLITSRQAPPGRVGAAVGGVDHNRMHLPFAVGGPGVPGAKRSKAEKRQSRDGERAKKKQPN